MAVESKASGSQAATLDTEHTLATITDAGVYQLWVDAAELSEGEALTLRVYAKVLSGGTERLADELSVRNGLGVPILYSVPYVAVHHIRFTLQQSGGVGRTFDWAVAQA